MAALDFYDPIGTGGVTQLTGQSPIVGDPEPVVQLTIGQYLTTGDLAYGDAGEAGGLSAMAFELWFVTNTSTPAGGDIIAYGPVADGTNRQWELDLGSTGLVTFKVRSQSLSNISATSSFALQPFTYYYLAGTLETATSCNLYVNGVLNATTAWNDSVRTSAFTAGSADMRLGDAGGAGVYTYADVAFYRHALTAARVAAHYTAGTQRGFPQETTDQRVRDALNAVGSSAPRNLRTGARSITPRYMSGQATQDAINEATVAEAVDAAFFIAADGTHTFLDSAHRSVSPWSTAQVTIGDGAGEVPYDTIDLDYSDSFLVNEWNVTREGSAQTPGQTQTASDATSIARYLKRPQSVTGIPVPADSDSLTIATAMLAKYKSPMQRVLGAGLDCQDAEVCLAVLRRELMDKITAKRTPPGGGARISQDLWIQKVTISGANDGSYPVAQWVLSPV